MKFFIQPYDPYDEALELFARHNATPPDEQDQTEDELVQLIVHKIKQHQRQTKAAASQD